MIGEMYENGGKAIRFYGRQGRTEEGYFKVFLRKCITNCFGCLSQKKCRPRV